MTSVNNLRSGISRYFIMPKLQKNEIGSIHDQIVILWNRIDAYLRNGTPMLQPDIKLVDDPGKFDPIIWIRSVRRSQDIITDTGHLTFNGRVLLDDNRNIRIVGVPTSRTVLSYIVERRLG